MCGKLKFCFLELSGIFFPNIFDPWLVDPMDAERLVAEGQLYMRCVLSISS